MRLCKMQRKSRLSSSNLNASRNLWCCPIRKLWSVWRRTCGRSGTLRRRIGASFVPCETRCSTSWGASPHVNLASFVSGTNGAPFPLFAGHVDCVSSRIFRRATRSPSARPRSHCRALRLQPPKAPITRPRSCARSAAISAASRTVAYFKSGMIEDLPAPSQLVEATTDDRVTDDWTGDAERFPSGQVSSSVLPST